MASPVPFPFELYLRRLTRDDIERVTRTLHANTGLKLPHHLHLVEQLAMHLAQRRHHNNKGHRQIKTGQTGRFIKRLARALRIPIKQHSAFDKRKG